MRRTAASAALLFACCACGGPGASPETAAALPPAAEPAPGIVLDQFGYRPDDAKVVRIRQAVEGFDAGAGEAPRTQYYVRRADTGETAGTFELDTAAMVSVDPQSGDRVWPLDISEIRTPGDYTVTSSDGVQVSPVFTIGNDIYKPILREAFRTFYYQRAGFAKAPPYAAAGWSDGASHLGPGQDTEARLYNRPNDASTARDLRGGWYDAGDYNQYTNWTADQCRTLLLSWIETPGAWGDDFGIPESGNGVSDLLDEAKWGVDWLLRMQNEDGSLLSVLGRDPASPPSAASGPSRYGKASTSATLSAAGTFALAAIIFRDSPAPGHADYAARLEKSALAAWQWAEANPAVTFYSNDARSDSEGLGAGQQEVEPEYLNGKRFAAAAYLSVLTGDEAFYTPMDAAFAETQMMRGGLIDAYRYEVQDAALFAARQPGAPKELRAQYAKLYADRLSRPPEAASYGVPVDAMHWGSNSVMARTGTLYLDAAGLAETAGAADAFRARALDYVHYLHGANPLGKVYLTNMGAFGAENAVTEFYHSWKTDPPISGFLVGGPNPTYDWDACCPTRCGSPGANKACGGARLSPPYGQPPLKAYRDFDDGWPLNSWQISENSNFYQAAYLRLLANFAGE